MAVQIQSDYPRGASRTRVSGLTASPGVPQMGGRDAETYLREMMRREDLALRRPRRAERVPVAAASRAMSRPAPKLASGRGSAGVQRLQAEAAREEALNRALAAKAARAPAPMKMVQGAQIMPGYVMDPNAMSAIQRQMFLPGSSGFADPGSAGLGSSAARATGEIHRTNAARQAAGAKGYKGSQVRR